MYLGLDLARRRAFPAAGRHEGGAQQETRRPWSTTSAARCATSAFPIRGMAREGQTHRRALSRRRHARQGRWREIEKLMPDLDAEDREDDGGEFRIDAALKLEGAEPDRRSSALRAEHHHARNRVNELGVAEPIIQQQGADRIVVQLPGVQDTAQAPRTFSAAPPRSKCAWSRRTPAIPPRATTIRRKSSRRSRATCRSAPSCSTSSADSVKEPLLLSKQVVITGERLTDASPSFDSQRPQAGGQRRRSTARARASCSTSRARRSSAAWRCC